MISFFRKIRHSLLNDNKMGRYLKYAVGEILLVVIGIFIALQLNLWKENYELNTVRQNYYEQLVEDLNKDKVFMMDYISTIDTLKASYRDYLESFNGKVMTPEEGLAKLKELEFGGVVISFNTSTVESLEKTGDIKILTQEIRNNLLDLKRTQDLLSERVRYNSLYQIEFLQDYSRAIGSESLFNRLETQPELKDHLADEIDLPKAFIALESTISWKIVTEKSGDFKELLKDVDHLIMLITNELN